MPNFAPLFAQAHAAGMAAGEAAQCQPMVVGSAASLFGSEIDRSKPVYYVADGVCGFAWVRFPGNKPFGRWAKKAGKARPSDYGGMRMSVPHFGQSMQRKEAYAHAFAGVLQAAGVEGVYSESRMD